MFVSTLVTVIVILFAHVQSSTASPVQNTHGIVSGKPSPPTGEGSRDQPIVYALPNPVVTFPQTFPIKRDIISGIVSSTTTTTAAPAISTKVLPRCNVPGYASLSLQQRLWGSTTTANVLGCQSACLSVSQCQSYSWLEKGFGGANCVFWAANGGGVVRDEESGLRWSDKYPGDGSNYCYESSQL